MPVGTCCESFLWWKLISRVISLGHLYYDRGQNVNHRWKGSWWVIEYGFHETLSHILWAHLSTVIIKVNAWYARWVKLEVLMIAKTCRTESVIFSIVSWLLFHHTQLLFLHLSPWIKVMGAADPVSCFHVSLYPFPSSKCTWEKSNFGSYPDTIW